MKSIFSKSFCVILLSVTCFAAQAWELDAQQSKISFVTIKKANIGEAHTFNEVAGGISEGQASVVVQSASVDTLVDIRNERLRKFVFESAKFPTIEVTADVKQVLKGLQVGEAKPASVNAHLSLHGVSKEIVLDVQVGMLSDSRIMVTTTKPVMIRAVDYSLLGGVEKLSSLMNGLLIAQTVPVSFSLIFSK